MVSMGLEINISAAREKVEEVINNGEAYNKFLELVKNQSGDINKIKVSNNKKYLKADKSGVLKGINALEVGKLSLELGSGKLSITDKIDYSVGVRLNKLVGDTIKKGDILATVYYNKKNIDADINKIFKIV